MPLDRQSIEKRDFPIGRRGYEPEAVDEHLARLADELESLKRRSERRSPESIAAVASQQVASIVQAAETTAADLERQAREESDRIRRDAERDAEETRDQAVGRSEEHVTRVSEATGQMLQRVDAMESELGALLESLRTGANRLQADLTLLQGSMGDMYDSAGRQRRGESARAVAREVRQGDADAPPRPAGAPGEPRAEAADKGPRIDEPAGGSEAPTGPGTPGDTATGEPPARGAEEQVAPVATAVEEGSAEGEEDVEGARLIALNMALNGTSREETERYLAENFDLSDRGGLLDEVYASVEG